MDWDQINWSALERLRSAFLSGTAGRKDYWQCETDLQSYDQTFAQRIGWKWDYVLDELKRRSWSPPAGPLLDWGCGTGIASRAFLDHFESGGISEVQLWDRSVLAMRFAQRRAKEKYPHLTVQTGSNSARPLGTLLISHILTELTDSQLDELLVWAPTATTILWVEPGTYEVSRKLIELRERLRATFQIVAPCPHQEECGMLSPGKLQHWCHHFAPSPPGVFTDSNWGRFAALAGIDLRSLPLSFLVLDRRPVAHPQPGTVRIIGRPRIYKPYALLLGCRSSGIDEQRLDKRVLPDEYRELKKGRFKPLQIW